MRILLLMMLAAGLHAGCSPRSSGPAPAAPVNPPQTSVPPQADPTAPARPSAGSSSPVAAPQTEPAAGPVRSLLAAYLESDGHGGWRKNEKAATELEQLSADDVAAAWTLLRAQDVQIRRAAAVFLLPQLDPASEAEVAAFRVLLTDSDRFVRARGIDAARQFSLVDRLKALPELTALLDSRREDRAENRAAAARLIGTLKQGAGDSLRDLVTVVQADPDANVRAAALAASAAISSELLVVEMLGKALADQDAAVRLAAASRLRQLGAAARPVSAALVAALRDADADVGEAAAEALIRIGSPAVEPLMQALAADHANAKKLALAALIKIGPAAQAAKGAIEKCKSDADPQVRQLAETALKRLAAP